MDNGTFETFRQIIYRKSGIVLTPQKLPLLSNRIQKRLTQLGIEEEAEYLKVIELDGSGDELNALIDAISTNVTSFYREEAHFLAYRELLRDWHEGGQQEFRVWCAAASSGEEPYTLAFEAEEALQGAYDYKILATDICTKVLKRAVQGIYSLPATEKIPCAIREAYTELVMHNGEEWRTIHPTIRRRILFKKMNLVEFPYPLKGPFDVIFCRNVMIYFDTPTRARIVQEFSRLLRSGGYLFLSHSENLLGFDHGLEKIGSSVYLKA